MADLWQIPRVGSRSDSQRRMQHAERIHRVWIYGKTPQISRHCHWCCTQTDGENDNMRIYHVIKTGQWWSAPQIRHSLHFVVSPKWVTDLTSWLLMPNCQLATPFHSRLRLRHGTDRRTDRQWSSLRNAPPFGGGGITSERDSKAFTVKVGLHQGSVGSLLLFLIVMEIIASRFASGITVCRWLDLDGREWGKSAWEIKSWKPKVWRWIQEKRRYCSVVIWKWGGIEM